MVFADARFPTGRTHRRGSGKVGSTALHSAVGHEHCSIHSWQLPPETSPSQPQTLLALIHPVEPQPRQVLWDPAGPKLRENAGLVL